MTDFTEEDVQRGVDAFPGVGVEWWAIEGVLAAGLPEYAKRVRAEALREAADAGDRNGHDVDWLYSRADAEEGKRDEQTTCSCGNRFDGDNLCMISACQWEGLEGG